MSEIEYTTKVKNGWRAIIYDAPWATFKAGQTGVTITSDGRACETTDDTKDSIIVVADANLYIDQKDTGHILFKQKGTDLFDIVCLKQNPGGSYSIIVDNVTVDGCDGTWTQFKQNLRVKEIINGVENVIEEGTGYIIISPTAQFDFTDSREYLDLVEVQSVKYPRESAKSNLIITAPEEEHDEIALNEDGTVNGEVILTDTTISQISESSYVYSINKSKNYSDCTGGTVYFSINKELIKKPTYRLKLVYKTIINMNTVKCGQIIERKTQEYEGGNDFIRYSVEGNVEVVTYSGGIMDLAIEDGVSEFKLIGKSSYNVSGFRIFKRGVDFGMIGA